jgi:hypothetical protein
LPQVVVGELARSAHEAFRANRRSAAILATLAIDHVDAIDGALSAFEVKRVSAVASADDALHVKFVRIAVRVHDFEAHDLDVATPCRQPDCPEPAVPSVNADRIAIPAAEGHLSAAKLDPPAVVSITALRHGIGHDRSGAHKRG